VTDLPDGLRHVDCRTRDRPNAYLVDAGACTLVDDDSVTLVDAGWPGDEETVRAAFDAAGLVPSDVDRVLLTHYDVDHVGTLARLTPELDAPVYVHAADAPFVAGDRLPPWTGRTVFGPIHRLLYRRLTLPDRPVRTVADGEDVGGFRAFHTPGHTPGHAVYVHEGLDAAFLGDLAVGVGSDLRPADRFSSYDAGENRESIRALLERVDDFEYACPGHGPPLDDGRARLAGAVA
jgi:glyoxylase-like metal-dependent hydrolase (beta-lactamase superfamily II)